MTRGAHIEHGTRQAEETVDEIRFTNDASRGRRRDRYGTLAPIETRHNGP
jgi:hypothetical protein